MTKFRCSNHALETDVGRHRKLNVEDCLCKLCKADVETELHFLQICHITKYEYDILITFHNTGYICCNVKTPN